MLVSVRNVVLSLILAAVAAASTTEEGTHAHEPSIVPYVFDHDFSGVQCDKAMKQHDEEDFRLFCINQRQSFQQCSLSCSQVLHFPSSTGVCKSYRCNFYDMSFPMMTDSPSSSSLNMNEMALGKVTLFSFSPLWEGHAQYNYELLELVRSLYPATTEALFLPIDIHDYELAHPRFEIKPFGEQHHHHEDEDEYRMDKGVVQRVHILPEVKPQDIGHHPFLGFVRTLLHREGAKNFDVYTDRPVIFVVSSDGTLVERLVVPTLETLQAAIEKYGGGHPIMDVTETTISQLL